MNKKVLKIADELTNKAMKWWTSLSINEQKKYVAMHPFYSKMYSTFVIEKKDGIKELYEYLKENNLL